MQIFFILIYFLAIFRLDLYYANRYFWNNNCKWERVGTSLMQPLMELFGNSMTAHFWHFENFKLDRNSFDHNKYVLQLNSSQNTFRRFGKLPILSFLSSAYVDINPFQTCAIIKPKNYKGKWKIVFARDWDNNIFSIEKCSHLGSVKVIVDGSGGIMAQNQNNELIELELVQYCKAWQSTDILFV